MRKNLGVKSYLYPMPVLIIASYDEAGKADVRPALHAVKLNLFDFVVGTLARFGEGISLCHDGQDAAAIGFITVFIRIPFGAGVVNGSI